MKKNLANIITGCRIICSILLLLFPVRSVAFYTLYVICGLRDMIDGAVARKTNSSSDFGARLDTVADVVFTAVAMIKLLPAIQLPGWLLLWIAAIAVMKISGVTVEFILRKRLLSLHSRMNKITGLALFLLPLTLQFIDIQCSAAAVCLLATCSAIQELRYVLTGREIP